MFDMYHGSCGLSFLRKIELDCREDEERGGMINKIKKLRRRRDGSKECKRELEVGSLVVFLQGVVRTWTSEMGRRMCDTFLVKMTFKPCTQKLSSYF